MEIPTKFRSILAGFRYWFLAFILFASSTMLVSCGGDDTTITITGGGSGGADTLIINAPSTVETGKTGTISVGASSGGVAVNGETLTFAINPNISFSKLSAASATTVGGVATVTYTAGTIVVPASDTINITGANDFYSLPDGTCSTDSTNTGAVLGCTFAIGVIGPGLDSVAVTALPTTIEAIAGGFKNQATIEALVTAAGTPLDGVAVDFTTTAGSICDFAASPCTGQVVNDVQTDASGIARITMQSSTIVEIATVSALAGFISGSTDVTFISGPAASFTLNANPVNITADQSSTSKVSALVRDEAGHIVADGAIVNFSVNTTSSTGTGDFEFPSSDATVGGIASRNFTAGATPGDIDVVVSSGGADSGTDGDGLITLIQEIVGTVTVAVEPDSLIANGDPANTVVVRAELKNSSGSPVNAGTEVTIQTSGGLLDFVSPIGSDGTAGVTSLIATTDSLGIASVFLQSNTTAGVYSVTATSGGRVGVDEVAFVGGPTDAANSQLTVSPSTIPADGATTATMTLTARDANNNLVADGKTVQFQATNDPGAVISNATTTSGGIATATITSSTTPGTVNLQAIIDGQTVTGCPSCATPVAQTQISFGATALGNPNSIALNLTGGSDADPDAVPPNPGSGTSLTVESPGGSNAIKIEATVNDTSGLPIVVDCTDNITFAIIAGPAGVKLDGIAVASVIKTTEAGVASVSLSAGTTPGTVRIQVTVTQNSSTCTAAGATTASATTTAITIASGAAASLFIYPNSDVIDNPDSSTSMLVNAMVTDLYGNPVEGGTAVFFDFTVAAGPGESVCPEVYTGGIPVSSCVGSPVGLPTLKGVASSILTWPPNSIFQPFDITAETLGGGVFNTYSSNYPAQADVKITVGVIPDSMTGSFSGIDVVATYEDGATNGGPNPIPNRTVDFISSNPALVSVNSASDVTNDFGQAFTTLDVNCVGPLEATPVTITAAEAPFSGEGTLSVTCP